MIYLLDTNTVSDWLTLHPLVTGNIEKTMRQGDVLGLAAPVHFEVIRGFRWKNQPRKEQIFKQKIISRLTYVRLMDADWLQAAQFWAQARRAGKQLSDIDCLIAALTVRLTATLASSDTDFDALPVTRVNWRSA